MSSTPTASTDGIPPLLSPGECPTGSDPQLSVILDSIGEGFYALDRDWRFSYFNRACETYFGTARADALGKVIWDLFPGMQGSEFEHRYRRAVAENRPDEFTTTSAAVQGRWVDVRIFPTENGLGVTFRDVTERRRAEEALREREAQLRELADALPVLVSLVGRDERYQFVNKGYEDWFGVPSEAVVGRPVREILGEEAYAGRLGYIKAALAGQPVTFQIVTPHGDGTRRDTEVRYVPRVGADGRIDGFYVLGADITERKRAETALGEQARTLEILHRTGAALAGELDLGRLVQSVTDAGTELAGAEFGAFFHNVIDEAKGEAFQLYALSGAPREAFANFPKPRNTAIFGPTFRGERVIRSDDVTKDPRYGRNAPHRGMPEGHLPVRSYLAVPVVSRSGEVLGCLLFGHSRPGVFTESVERIITGIAAQAAIAIDNARLYQAAQQEIAKRERSEAALRLLAEAGALFSGSLDYDATLHNIVRLMIGFLADICLFDRLTPDGKVERAAWADVDPERQGRLETFWNARPLRSLADPAHDGNPLFRTLRSGETSFLPRIDEDLLRRAFADAEEYRSAQSLNLGGVIVVPVTARGKVLGALTFCRLAERTYTAEDCRLAEELGRRAGVALDNARLHRALSESEDRLRIAVEATEMGTFDYDPASGALEWSDRCKALFDLPPDAALDYGTFLNAVHPDDRGAAHEAMRRAFDPDGDGEYRGEFRVFGVRGGGERWLAAKGRVFFDGRRAVRFTGTVLDITERRRGEEHLKLLLGELSHRVKNTLATVKSIAAQTLRTTDTPEAFKAAFTARLMGLSQTHSLLSQGNWEGASLRDVILGEVMPYLNDEASRVVLTGPDLRLSPRMALSLGMAFHELATNAAKHGALAVPSGRVEISWAAAMDRSGGRLSLHWAERGGRPVREPTRRGFGSHLIERGVAHELNGEARLVFEETGLRCTIEVPLRAERAPGTAGHGFTIALPPG